jgi:hypothetical protein
MLLYLEYFFDIFLILGALTKTLFILSGSSSISSIRALALDGCKFLFIHILIAIINNTDIDAITFLVEATETSIHA